MPNSFYSLLVGIEALREMPPERLLATKNAANDAELSILLTLGTVGRLSAFAVNSGDYDGEEALKDMKTISATLETLSGVLVALSGVKANAADFLAAHEAGVNHV